MTHKAAESKTEGHAVNHEEENQRKQIRKLTSLRHLEQRRNHKQTVAGNADINQSIGRSPSDERAVVSCLSFPHRTVHHAHTEEHSLLYDKKKRRRKEENQERPIRVERDVFLCRNGLHHLCDCLVRHSQRRKTCRLYRPEFVNHHVIHRHRYILIIEEAGHIRIGRNRRLFHPREPVAVILRKKDDSAHLSLLHQLLRLRHRDTFVGHIHLTGRVNLLDKPAAVRTLAQIDHSHRHLVHRTFIVDETVYNRIEKSAEQKYDEDV